MKQVNEYGEPGSTFIQWKGTEVCMDIICPCGEGLHIDAGFAYAYRCPACQKVYRLGTEVSVIEDPDPSGSVVEAEGAERDETEEVKRRDGVHQARTR